MAKLAFVSDVHLSSQTPVCRKDDLRAVQWAKLTFVYEQAIARRCYAVVLAGDVVDIACSWVLLPELAKFMAHWKEQLETYVVFGQHDTYMYDAAGRSKTIIGALAAARLIEVLDHHPQPLPGKDTYLYGASYGQPPPNHTIKGSGILVLHGPVCDQALWADQSYLDAKHYLAEHPQFDLIVCGDIHRAFNIGLGTRRIINTGPLLRRKADEADHHPHFYIYDTQNGKLETVPVPHAAAEDVISREHLERERAYDQLVNQLQSPHGAAAANTDIQFSDTLQEVAAANPDKITPNVVRLLSTLTGVTLKEGTHSHGQQQKATTSRRSQPPGS